MSGSGDRADTIGHTERTTDGQSDSNIPIPIYWGGGGYFFYTENKTLTRLAVHYDKKNKKHAGYIWH